MPLKYKKMKNGIFDIDKPIYKIQSSDWKTLEFVIGVKITNYQKNKVDLILQEYFIRRTIENNAKTYKEYYDYTNKIINAISILQSLLNPNEDDIKDVSSAVVSSTNLNLVEGAFSKNSFSCPRYRVFITPDELLAYGENPLFSINDYQLEAHLPEAIRGSILLVLQASDLRNALAVFGIAVEKTRSEYEQDLPLRPKAQYGDQSAFAELLLTIRDWAVESNLPSGIKMTDGSAGPLVRFVFKMNSLLPEKYRGRVASSEALVKQFTRAKQSPSSGTTKNPD